MNDDLIRRGKIGNDIALYMAENAYLNDTALDVLKMIAKWVEEQPAVDAVEVQEWISVKDRLPNPFTPVLVYRQSFGTLPPYIKVDKMTLWNDDTQVWVDEVGNWKNVTTHWMPLPKPPKG